MGLLNRLFKSKSFPIGTIRTQGGVKKKKVANGKWIPVAKPKTIHKKENNKTLTPEKDYKQNGVRSKAFKAWFGDWENDPNNASKVVDKKTGKPKETYNTAPIKVYHGTSFGGFKSFKKEYAAPGLFGSGFYFTEDKSIAEQYANPTSRVERVYTHYFDLDDSEEKKKVLRIFKKYKKINEKEAKNAYEFYTKYKKVKDSRTHSAAQRAYRIYLAAKKRVNNLDYYLTHSKDNAAINKFIDESKYRNSSYLTTDWRVYEDIKKTVKQLKPKIYELYLNIRKPLDLDSKIPLDLKKTIIKDKDMVRHIQQGVKSLESRAKIAGMQLNKKNLRLMLKEAKTYREYMAVFAKITEEEDDMEGPTRLRFIELVKKHTGCDGFTHIGGGLMDKKGKKHKVWIAFKPTQMKAVDNVGTFNPKTTNIFKAQTPEHTLLKHKNNWYVVADSKWQLFYWFPRNLEKAYKLQGRTTFQDLPISIENRKGSVRHWYDPMKDEHGETKMKYPYGYIRLTEGADGEHVDVYIGDNKNSRKVFVVRQQNPKTGEYDEDKVMLGFDNPKEAKEAYLMHYNDPRFFGSMDEYDMDTFKDHIKRKKGKISVSGRLNKAYYSAEDLKNKNMRWVTIRGNHVLVQGLADGGYVVVGGAGGALNHLRLDKLLSKEEYAQKEKERKERAKKVFNELTPEEKREQLEQRKKIVEAKRKLRSSYAEKVASILGTSISDLKSKISLQDMDEIERRARKEVEAKKKRRISEADKEDIEKQKAKEIEKEVKKKIKTAEQSAVDVLAKDFLGDDLDPNGKVSAKKLLDTKKAMEILKAKKEFNKQLKQLGKERAEYSTRLKEGDVFAGNSKSLDSDILKQVREDIETQKNVKMYDKLNAQALSIQKHIDTGAVNALNGILSEVYGTGALFNADVVQNLGIEALARTISVKLQLDGRGEVVRKALIDYAKQYREKVVDQATKEFDSRMEKADVLRSLAVDSEDGAALLSKASANGHALKQIVQGQKALGMAVGSLRGVAHLINALEESPQDRVVIDAGKNLLEARQKARAAGLLRGSYSIKTYQRGKGKRLVIEIPRSTITSFFTNNQANRRQERLNDLIKAHKENTGYKPPGIKQSIKLDPAQEAGLRFFKNNKKVLLDFEAGLGKAQPLDSKILTPNGWVLMGDVKKGDLVIDGNGKPVEVLGVFPQGKQSVYKLTFSDGSRTECTLEHLWRVKKPYDIYAKKDWRVLTLEEMITGNNRGGRGAPSKKGLMTGHHYKYRIPQVKPVMFNKRMIDISPYVLGAILGDGGLTRSTVRFSSEDAFIIGKLSKLVPSSIQMNKAKGDNVDYSLVNKAWKRGGVPLKNELREYLNKLNLIGLKSEYKFIPKDYLYSSVSDRLALLQGLMDTDGWVSKDGMIIQYSSSSKRLIDDVKTLVQSLGGTVKLHSKYPKLNGVVMKKHYTLTISLNICPFSTPRKVKKWNKHVKYGPLRNLINVEYARDALTQCIKVDSDTETYITDDFIVTHNTALAYTGAMEAIHNSGAKKVLIVTPAKLRTQMYSERKVFLDDENQKLVHPPTTDKTKRIANYAKDGITIIGHDQLRTDADIIKNANYDMIVVDEIHEMTSKGSESGRYKGMMKLKDIPMKIGMSGTNIKNDKSEVYKKINFIDPEHTLGSLADFNKRYKGLNQSTGIFFDSSNDAFRKDISKWVYTQKNHLPVHNDIEMLRVNLSKRQREMYAQSEDIYRKEKANKRIGASARRDARNYKIIQNTDSQDNAKISKIVDIMRNKHPEEKAVIHVTGLSAMQTAKKRLEQEFGKGSVGLIHGSSRANEVRKVKQAFNDPGNPLRFIIGTKSLEAGHNLQGGGTVTFQLDLPDTYASFDQRNKRIYRKGQNKDVKTYVLSGHNPYDMRREDILDTKKREMGLMGNPREIENMDESGFLALMRKYETGESDAIKESAKTA